MTLPPLDAAAAVAILLAVIAVTRTRGAPGVLLGAGAIALLAPLSVDPPPAVLPLAIRTVAILLGAYVAMAAVAGHAGRVDPLPLGGGPEALFLAAVFATGVGTTGALTLGGAAAPGVTPLAALIEPFAFAAALTVGALAVVLVAHGRHALQAGSGTVLAIVAADLFVRAVRTSDAVTEVSAGIALLAGFAVGAAIARAADGREDESSRADETGG